MQNYEPKLLKSIALFGHQASGKSSLMEALLFRSGHLSKKGSVDDGNSVSDASKEEKNAKFSIYSSLIPIEYQKAKYNFIDTPGFFDFEMETHGALRVVRNAIIVLDGVKGVEVGSRKAWRQVRKNSLPTVVFVNKMDKENIKLEEILDDLRKHFEKKAIPFTWPIGTASEHRGYLHIVDMTASVDNKVVEIPAEYQDLAKELHNQIIEAAANHDDDIMEKYFSEEEIGLEELKAALKKAVNAGTLVPTVFGSAHKNSGVKALLDICAEYLSAEDLERLAFDENNEAPSLKETIDPSASFSAFVWKTSVDPFVGKISYIKVLSGSLKKDDTILNVSKDSKERINNISFIRGKEFIETSSISAGDFGVITKVASLETGDSLSDVANPVQLEGIEALEPTIYYALTVKNKNDEGKITDALRKICSEDLSIRSERNAETKQLLVGCQGQAQMDIVVEKLKNIYNIEVLLSAAKISYRETIKGKSDVEGRYIKQSGGSGQYGVVKIEFEHSDEKDFEFVNDIFGGAVPSNYVPAVEKGLEEAMKTGVLAGYPVIGLKARLYDGKYHPVDSSELAFKMAASLAFKDGCAKAKPTLLEPIMEVKVVGPNEFIGDIMGDLSKRRGIIMGIDPVGEEQYITAEVPQSELQSYIIDLKTMTQAQATFTMKFIRYDEVPSNLVDKIIQEAKAEQ